MSDAPTLDGKGRHSWLARCGGALLLSVLFFAVYMGAYYLAATPVLVVVTLPAGDIGVEHRCVCTFHGWTLPDAIFWPAHQIDCRLRPEIWRKATP